MADEETTTGAPFNEIIQIKIDEAYFAEQLERISKLYAEKLSQMGGGGNTPVDKTTTSFKTLEDTVAKMGKESADVMSSLATQVTSSLDKIDVALKNMSATAKTASADTVASVQQASNALKTVMTPHGPESVSASQLTMWQNQQAARTNVTETRTDAAQRKRELSVLDNDIKTRLNLEEGYYSSIFQLERAKEQLIEAERARELTALKADITSRSNIDSQYYATINTFEKEKELARDATRARELTALKADIVKRSELEAEYYASIRIFEKEKEAVRQATRAQELAALKADIIARNESLIARQQLAAANQNVASTSTKAATALAAPATVLDRMGGSIIKAFASAARFMLAWTVIGAVFNTILGIPGKLMGAVKEGMDYLEVLQNRQTDIKEALLENVRYSKDYANNLKLAGDAAAFATEKIQDVAAKMALNPEKIEAGLKSMIQGGGLKALNGDLERAVDLTGKMLSLMRARGVNENNQRRFITEVNDLMTGQVKKTNSILMVLNIKLEKWKQIREEAIKNGNLDDVIEAKLQAVNQRLATAKDRWTDLNQMVSIYKKEFLAAVANEAWQLLIGILQEVKRLWEENREQLLLVAQALGKVLADAIRFGSEGHWDLAKAAMKQLLSYAIDLAKFLAHSTNEIITVAELARTLRWQDFNPFENAQKSMERSNWRGQIIAGYKAAQQQIESDAKHARNFLYGIENEDTQAAQREKEITQAKADVEIALSYMAEGEAKKKKMAEDTAKAIAEVNKRYPNLPSKQVIELNKQINALDQQIREKQLALEAEEGKKQRKNISSEIKKLTDERNVLREQRKKLTQPPIEAYTDKANLFDKDGKSKSDHALLAARAEWKRITDEIKEGAQEQVEAINVAEHLRTISVEQGSIERTKIYEVEVENMRRAAEAYKKEIALPKYKLDPNQLIAAKQMADSAVSALERANSAKVTQETLKTLDEAYRRGKILDEEYRDAILARIDQVQTAEKQAAEDGERTRTQQVEAEIAAEKARYEAQLAFLNERTRKADSGPEQFEVYQQRVALEQATQNKLMELQGRLKAAQRADHLEYMQMLAEEAQARVESAQRRLEIDKARGTSPYIQAQQEQGIANLEVDAAQAQFQRAIAGVAAAANQTAERQREAGKILVEAIQALQKAKMLAQRLTVGGSVRSGLTEGIFGADIFRKDTWSSKTKTDANGNIITVATTGLDKVGIAASAAAKALQVIPGIVGAWQAGKEAGGTLGGIGAVAGSIGGMIAGPVGMIVSGVGAVFSFIGSLFGNAAKKIQKQIRGEMENIMYAYSMGWSTITQTLDRLEAERAEARRKLSGWKLTEIEIEIGKQEDQLKKAAEDIKKNFVDAVNALRAGGPVLQDWYKSWIEINKQVADFLYAGGNWNDAYDFLRLTMAEKRLDLQEQLNEGEQEAIQDAIKMNDLLQQKNDLVKDYNQKVFEATTKDSIVRRGSSAIQTGRELAQAKADMQKRIKDIDNEIRLTTDRLNKEKSIFNISSDIEQLHRRDEELSLQALDQQLMKYQEMQKLLNATASGNIWSGWVPSFMPGISVPPSATNITVTVNVPPTVLPSPTSTGTGTANVITTAKTIARTVADELEWRMRTRGY